MWGILSSYIDNNRSCVAEREKGLDVAKLNPGREVTVQQPSCLLVQNNQLSVAESKMKSTAVVANLNFNNNQASLSLKRTDCQDSGFSFIQNKR